MRIPYKKNRCRTALLLLFSSLLCMSGCAQGDTKVESVAGRMQAKKEWKDVSVHDPSILEDNGTYYIFGSHLSAASSKDLMDWSMIGEGVINQNPIIPGVKEEMKEAFAWAKTNTFWAPDVIQLNDGKYYMYYCNCEGSSPLSCMGLAVSEKIEGPYKDLGIFLKSGQAGYDATVLPNVVDPDVFFDKDGKLWMVYGSYSGGIYILEMNELTGLPLKEGYGKRLLGGNHLRIEAPFMQYNQETGYYYLFLSFGGLASDGGYQIRVCRSENPDGPFYDSQGKPMEECSGEKGSFFDDRKAEQYGVKLLGNYKWSYNEGEESSDRRGYLSPGHNSVCYDGENDKYFIIFHTRFEKAGESHSVRVHQMFFNEDGWPVIAPYRYAGESAGTYDKEDLSGNYKILNHGRQITTQLKESVDITLHKDGTVTGAFSGTWESNGSNMTITLQDQIYRGIFLRQYDDNGNKEVMTFTALSKEGTAVWGSGLNNLEANE